MSQNTTSPPDPDKPPFFNSWNHLYALVLGFLITLIILFTWLTESFK